RTRSGILTSRPGSTSQHPEGDCAASCVAQAPEECQALLQECLYLLIVILGVRQMSRCIERLGPNECSYALTVRQGAFQEGATFVPVAPDVPAPQQCATHPQRLRDLLCSPHSSLQQKGERCAQVLVLLLQPRQPLALLGAPQVRLGLLRKSQIVPRVRGSR